MTDVLAIDERPVEKVECPEWGGDVYLTTMSCRDLDRIELKFHLGASDPELAAGLTAEYVAACWCNERGDRETVTTEQIKKLAEKHPAPLRRLLIRAQLLHSQKESEKN